MPRHDFPFCFTINRCNSNSFPSCRLDLSFEDTDFMFDAIFNTQLEPHDSGYETSDHPATSSEIDQPLAAIRVYPNDQEMYV